MLITLVQDQFRQGPPLTIFVPEDRADDVISGMATEGWHVLSKIYEPAAPVVDSLQVALLQVSEMPAGEPIRVAVEYGALSAISKAPMAAVPNSPSPPVPPQTKAASRKARPAQAASQPARSRRPARRARRRKASTRH